MGPAAAALFAGYQPSGNKQPDMMNTTNPKGLMMRGASNFPPWSPSLAASSPSLAPFSNPESMTMLSMAAPPPALPFVSFPKNLSTMPSMPWMGASSSTSNNNANAELFNLNEDEFEDKQEEEDFEAAELEELLEFTMPDDVLSAEKDKEDLVNLDDGFDGTEMSILYSFLVDAPEEKSSAKKALELEDDDGILNLNMLAGSPIESLMESLDEDFTDEELKMSPHAPCSDDRVMKIKPSGEVKSRRLCRSEGCYKRSRSNGMCISHGGGRRCAIDGCDKSSQGGNLCIRHGGGKRCSHDGCDKAAQSNFLCKAHGGGPRCQVDGCHRSSQGGGYCRSHGGGKRCMFDGCDKGTQRGDYCALHGGSRLCEVTGCMRNDRGGGLCATHGGGKRCTMGNCGKPCRRKGLCSAHLRQAEAK
jgi:hypothetical protein